jgi:small subunit ribosomal protein S16
MIRIRLRRVGKKHHPYYRIVVANQPDKRDGDFLENLGSYDPHTDPPSVVVDAEKAKAWIAKGAQPSEAADKLLRRAGVITTPAPVRAQKTAAPAAAAKA